ncbi:unnamed protein product [Somion occarium]|uniref:Uncharacterized protein n=1 Tax=Somion occarium TaxID=3059160 RepID=A0ABP1DTZ4_9APHY
MGVETEGTIRRPIVRLRKGKTAKTSNIPERKGDEDGASMNEEGSHHSDGVLNVNNSELTISSPVDELEGSSEVRSGSELEAQTTKEGSKSGETEGRR